MPETYCPQVRMPQKSRRKTNGGLNKMEYIRKFEQWKNSPNLTDGEKAELISIENDEKEIESRFSLNLQFGTAGLRGIMGLGTNRMNIHVIRHTTQAFALVIKETVPDASVRGVAICYDCRNGSESFAREAACIMASNGIPVKIFEAMRPTPELSFAIRRYGCAAGINITASHNPKEYNGYKVYWSDGAQLPPNHAKAIAEKTEKLDIFGDIKTMSYDDAVEKNMITLLGAATDEAFLESVLSQANDFSAVQKVSDTFKMVYTPFHGAGYKLIPEALKRLGMKHVLCVPEQMIPDGNFPTVVSPNPENPEGFYLAADLAKKHGADFILGSDPDADRVGIMVKNADGEYITISGNQTGVLLLDYLISARKRRGTMPCSPVSLKTIVTTEMARKVSESHGVKCCDTFTGFKYMAEKKNALEEKGEGKVIFSYEESYGYMIGDYVRDKDAVTASLLLTEMAAWYAAKGMTLYDALCALYEKYGYYDEKTVSIVMPGLEGMAKMRGIMESLRSDTPKSIGGTGVCRVYDYSDGYEMDISSGTRKKIELSGSNVLSYILADDTKIVVRPSGTEPKIKIYILANGKTSAECEEKIRKYLIWADSFKK